MLKLPKILIAGKGARTVLDVDISSTLWLLLLFFFLMVVFFRTYIFPLRFFIDAEHFAINYIPYAHGLKAGDAFTSTAAIYNFLHLNDRKIAVPLVQGGFYAFFIYYVISRFSNRGINLYIYILCACLLLIAAPFMGTYSKEPVVAFLTFVFLFTNGRFWRLVVWSLLVLFYAYYFRPYWALLLCFYWYLYCLAQAKMKPLGMLASAWGAMLVLAFLFPAIMGVSLDSFRLHVNHIRTAHGTVAAATMIHPYLPVGGSVISWLNVFLTWIFLFFPFPLLIMGEIYYFAIFIVLSAIFGSFIKAFFKMKKEVGVNRVVCVNILVLSMTLVQSIFEPDYGSFVRHLAPFYPLMFYSLFYALGKDLSSSKYSASVASACTHV